MRLLVLYLAAINIIALLAMCIDKYKAQRHKWRISEAALFVLGLLGGGVGAYAGMWLFHHKTKHLKFTIGIPAVIIMNMVVLWYLLQWLGLK